MSPTRLVEHRTLEVISISLERPEEPRELGVCLEEAIKGQRHHNSHRHVESAVPVCGAEVLSPQIDTQL